jgi:GTPase
VVDIRPIDGSDPVEQVQTIERELASFDSELVDRPRWLVINKMDVFDDEEELEATANDIVNRLGWTGPSFLISAAGQQGTREVCLQVQQFFDAERAARKLEQEATDDVRMRGE